MQILNKSERNFIIDEITLVPNTTCEIDEETGAKLVVSYPGEIIAIGEPKPVEKEPEEVKEEKPAVKPKSKKKA